jgi:hypothetical protein
VQSARFVGAAVSSVAMPMPRNMPRVLNANDLRGADKRVIIPEGAVYIGRWNSFHRLPRSKWANTPLPRDATDEQRAASIAAYEARLRSDPARMAQLHELRGRDLVCWCKPADCHGDVLLRLANA